MIQEIDRKINHIIEKQRLKKKLEVDLLAVEAELCEKNNRLAELEAQLNQEKGDVEKLEHFSLTTLFYTVLGSREEQLEKERQEWLSAQLRYQQHKEQIAFLLQEQSHLQRQLDALTNLDAEYAALLTEKERLILQSNPAAAQELIAASQEMAHLNAELKEIAEAIAAGEAVLEQVDLVISSLKSAEGWGTWDLLGGGLISTAMKHNRMDEARNGVNEIEKRMSRFRRELLDVQLNTNIQIDIGEFTSFADYFFDGLIVDWVVQSKIENALAQATQARQAVCQALENLKGMKNAAAQKLNAWQEKRNQQIIQA
ncbi:MAG TPA: hypothetical protein PKW33_19585 [Anaerolineaceae bacterium]|nr:hypothetical protein [Anaerolineaceae bacterium]HPN53807.1 hypothetical protein [Anaerolineaceae bacterium]